jgi:hypothetical protein
MARASAANSASTGRSGVTLASASVAITQPAACARRFDRRFADLARAGEHRLFFQPNPGRPCRPSPGGLLDGERDAPSPRAAVDGGEAELFLKVMSRRLTQAWPNIGEAPRCEAKARARKLLRTKAPSLQEISDDKRHPHDKPH